MSCMFESLLPSWDDIDTIPGFALRSSSRFLLQHRRNIGIPHRLPSETSPTVSFALNTIVRDADVLPLVNGWTDGYAFILSFLAPLWTICTCVIGSLIALIQVYFALLGSFDSSVHISEEASNAAVAVPWAIVYAIGIAGILGWGQYTLSHLSLRLAHNTFILAINIALAFCMGTDIEGILGSSVGQPMATIFFNAFGQKGTLALWAFVVLVQYMMGSSMVRSILCASLCFTETPLQVLAASRQSFAFSRDGALPFSSWLYRMNSFTGTPVNTVLFTCISSLLLGLLAFAGDAAINAVFSLSVVALYVAYAIPIAARFLGNNDFRPGPFSLGRWGAPVAVISIAWMAFMGIVFLFPSTPTTSVADMNYTVVRTHLYKPHCGVLNIWLCRLCSAECSCSPSCGTTSRCTEVCIGSRDL